MPTTTNQNPECLVIPLAKNTQAYKAHLSRTDKTENCLVYNLELLKSKQSSFSRNQLLNWQQILEEHLKTVKKLILKDMGEYGTGVFTRSKVYFHELVIYPGQLIDTSLHKHLSPEERIYFLQIPNETNLHVDSKYTDCIAKYFQHLPVPDPNMLADFDGEIPAYENFGSNCAYVKIKCENEYYIVPVRVFMARRDICANSIVGFDYGKEYWRCLNWDFTYFTAAGTPISCYYLNCNNTKYQLSQAAYTALLKHGYFLDSNRLLFLPREVRDTFDDLPTLSNEGSVSVRVRAIAEFNIKNCSIFFDETKQEAKAILIKLPAQVTMIRIHPDLVVFSDIENFPVAAPIPPLSISKLLNTSIEKLISLEKALNKFMDSPLLLDVKPCALAERVLIFSLMEQGIFRRGSKVEFSREDCLGVTQRRITR